jgi:hypothetical protein
VPPRFNNQPSVNHRYVVDRIRRWPWRCVCGPGSRGGHVRIAPALISPFSFFNVAARPQHLHPSRYQRGAEAIEYEVIAPTAC